ncbi:hypothetical protein Hanom_Chr16g01423801 [Helianthus anomalus]
MELCRFTDPDIDRLRSCFPARTIFRPFDSSTKSDSISDVWITFLATPFLIGFTYPFSALPEGFFTLTGLCYIQAMPMVWRILHTLDHIIEQEGIDIGMSELSQLYNLVTISLSHIQISSAIEERIKDFWKLDPAIRTFPPKSQDSVEVSPTSYTMSSTGKSSKSASRFSVSDLDAFAASKSIKKHLAANPSVPNPKTMSIRGKGAKKRKVVEALESLPLIQH